MTCWRGVLCVLALLPTAGRAEDAIDYGSIDGFVVPHASFAARWPASADVDQDGNGLGVRVMSRVTDSFMITGEAQRVSHDSVEATQLRIGAGLANASTTGVFLTLDRFALDVEDATALGLHLRVAGRPAASVGLYGDVAYLGVDGHTFYHDGFELTAGATLDFTMPWGLFADYRATVVDDRDGADRLDLRQFRLGIRFRFDC